MSTIRVRRLTSSGDYSAGQSRSNFAVDLEAIGWILSSRLRLLVGEWWENRNLGLPLFQSILGQPNNQKAIALLIQQNILGNPYVISVSNVSTTYFPGVGPFNMWTAGIGWNQGPYGGGGFIPWGGLAAASTPAGPGPGARAFTFSCTVQTSFGTLGMATVPSPLNSSAVISS